MHIISITLTDKSFTAKISPKHRGPLGKPSAISMDSMLAEISISLDHGPITLNECDDTTYDGWMSNLCDEPIGDAKICCLGFWLPCLLYGKVDERIKLVQQGKNPEDAGNGCGADCLIWQVGCFGFAGENYFRPLMKICCPGFPN